MNFIWAILALSIFANDCLAKKKKLDLDFEFVDKVIKSFSFLHSIPFQFNVLKPIYYGMLCALCAFNT